MRICKFAVRNFRRIPDFQLDVRDHLVLVGPNDSGKTSILQLISYLLGRSSQAQIAYALQRRDFTDPEQPLVAEAELCSFDDAERAAFPDEISVGPPERLVIRLEATLSAAEPDAPAVFRRFPEAGHERAPNRDQLAAIGWEYIPASRYLTRELSAGRTGVLRSLLESLDLGDDQQALEAMLQRLQDVLQSAGALTEFRRELASALSAALPVEVPETRIRVTSRSELQDHPLADVQLGLEEAGRTTPILEQSDGFQALVAIAAFGIAHRGSNIVAVDEPEMHLHPIAQRSVANLLVSDDTNQRVVATHSPHFAAICAPEDLVALGPDRLPRQLPPGSRISEWQNVARWWKYDLLEPVTARRILAVEGPADRMIVEASARRLGVDLDRLGVNVLELGGADQFELIYRLLGPSGFDLPLGGLVDQDHADQWAELVGVVTSDLGLRGIQVCNPDLEGEYVAALGIARVVDLLVSSGLFTQAMVLRGSGTSDLTSVTPAHVASFCRAKRNKVRAAAAIARGMTEADAGALQPLADLLVAL